MASDPRFKNTIFATGGTHMVPMSAATQTKIQNVFEGALMGGARKVSYHLLDKVEAFSWYHYNASGSIHLLKADMICEVNENLYVIVTEKIEYTLESWVKANANNIINPLTGEPTEDLKRILWGVLRGLKHLSIQDLQHGNVKPLSVFVVNGIGCLGRPSSDSKNPPRQDIDGFSDILEFLFAMQAQKGASLRRLMSCLKPLAPPYLPHPVGLRLSYFYSCDSHSALISAKAKVAFRHNALLEIKRLGLPIYNQVSMRLNALLNMRRPPQILWIKNVRNVVIAGYREALVKSVEPQNLKGPTTYSFEPISFLLYGRNLMEHLDEYNFTDTIEEIEARLESFFPGCLAALLEAMIELLIAIPA